MRSPVYFAGLLALLACASTASAQFIEVRQINGKSVWCSRSINFDSLRSDCARVAYAYVFVGSISSITLVDNDETRLEITPEEIFHGNPGTPLAVLTVQGLCLPRMHVGDRWLFLLNKEESKPAVLDYFSNPSRPIADAQPEIELLRRLKTIGDSGMVRGQVLHSNYANKQIPVPQATIKAQRQSDGQQFVGVSDADGYYEFPPLPAGRYQFTVDPIQGLRFDDSAPSGWPVTAGSCLDLPIISFPHAKLGGHVRRANGLPVSRAEVVIRTINDNSRLTTAYTDSDGRYSVNSLPPANYIVGINLSGKPAAQSGANGAFAPNLSTYYRDAPNLSAAMTIQLSDGDKRDDIDFVLPDH